MRRQGPDDCGEQGGGCRRDVVAVPVHQFPATLLSSALSVPAHWAHPSVAVLVLAVAALFIGFVLPGGTAVPLVIVVGAVTVDSGYVVGRRLGRASWHPARSTAPSRVADGRSDVRKHERQHTQCEQDRGNGQVQSDRPHT